MAAVVYRKKEAKMVILSFIGLLVSLFQLIGILFYVLCMALFLVMTGGVLYFAARQFIGTAKGVDDDICGIMGMFTSGLLIYWSPGLFISGGLFYLSASITGGGLFGMQGTQILIATLIIACLAAIASAGVFNIIWSGCRTVKTFFTIFSNGNCGSFFGNLGIFLLHSIVFLPVAYVIYILLVWLVPIAYTPIVK